MVPSTPLPKTLYQNLVRGTPAKALVSLNNRLPGIMYDKPPADKILDLDHAMAICLAARMLHCGGWGF